MMNRLISRIKRDSADSVLMEQQIVVIRRLILGVMVLSILGSIVTWFVSVDSRMTQLFLIVTVSLVSVGGVSLLLLRYRHIILASVLISIGLHIATTITIVPYGVFEGAVIAMSFTIPVILLGYVWGRLGAITSLFSTSASYLILLFLDSRGLTGWAIRVKVLWVDAGLQLTVLCIIGFIIIYLQSAIIRVNQRLEESQKNLQRFLKRTAHDMSAPVQGLYAATEVLDVASRNNIAAHLNTLRLFIDQTRAFVELQEHNLRLSRERVFVLPVCAASMMSVSRQSLEKRVFLHIDCDVENPCVCGDELAVRRIVDNLLANAVRFTSPDLSVVVRIRRLGTFVEISIIDSGPGLSEEQQKSLFKHSRNLELNEQGGWGVGLIIVQELTTAMGGVCGVISALGAGSTFWVQLPVGD